MTDLISRLRALSRHEHDDLTIGDEAADELERLRAENSRMNALLLQVQRRLDSATDDAEPAH